MSPDWNAIRLDLVGLDEPTRASLRQMRPFFASALPDILARFYDKVRQYDPSCGIFREGAMQEAIRMQLQHWNLIGGGDFGLPAGDGLDPAEGFLDPLADARLCA